MRSGPRPVALWQSSGHEGDFVSVRRPYEWKKGKYTYRVVRMDREVVEGKPCTWVGAFVYSHENDENIFVGALRFPGENLVLASKLASFVEIYGRPIPVEQIPKLTVTFGNLRVNGQPVEKPSATAVYPKRSPGLRRGRGAGRAVGRQSWRAGAGSQRTAGGVVAGEVVRRAGEREMGYHNDTHSVLVGYILWIFGFTGAHRFYYGKPITGTIWFFTAGLLLIGWIIDLFLIPGMDRRADFRYQAGPLDYTVAWVLLTFLGIFGIHRFYMGKWITGIIYLLTGGLAGPGAALRPVDAQRAGQSRSIGGKCWWEGKDDAQTQCRIADVPHQGRGHPSPAGPSWRPLLSQQGRRGLVDSQGRTGRRTKTCSSPPSGNSRKRPA